MKALVDAQPHWCAVSVTDVSSASSLSAWKRRTCVRHCGNVSPISVWKRRERVRSLTQASVASALSGRSSAGFSCRLAHTFALTSAGLDLPFSLHVTLGQDYLPNRVRTAGGVTLGLTVRARSRLRSGVLGLWGSASRG